MWMVVFCICWLAMLVVMATTIYADARLRTLRGAGQLPADTPDFVNWTFFLIGPIHVAYFADFHRLGDKQLRTCVMVLRVAFAIVAAGFLFLIPSAAAG